MTPTCVHKPSLTLIRRGRLPPCSRRHHLVDSRKRLSGRNALPDREPHPITIMSPTTQSRTKISLGARAHEHPDPTTRNHSPPTNDYPRLTDETQHR